MSTSSEPMPVNVELRDVAKRLADREVLRDVSMQLRAGRLLALLGPNGAGKTTTVRIMTGLVAPDAGTVAVSGQQVTAASADRLRAQFGVQSDGNLYGALSIRDNLDIWGRIFGLTTQQRRARVTELLETFRLSDRGNDRVGALSKGLTQRVALARALIASPPILLLDEPTAGLDPSSVRELYAFLGDLRLGGTAVMVCTHQLDGIEGICDDVAILDGGRIQAQGDLRQLIDARFETTTVRVRVGSGSSERYHEIVNGLLNRGITAALTDVDEGCFTITLPDDDAIPVLVELLGQRGESVYQVAPIEKTLEDLYFDLLGDQT